MHIPWYLRLVSFVLPVNIRNLHSQVSGPIELNLYTNKLMLDTKNANYSFGTLHTIMQKAINTAFKQNANINSVLLLGFAGGSAAQILFKKLPTVLITAIEYDELMIEIYKKYFKTKPINLIQQNADVFVKTTLNKYDLVICDLFINKTKPAFTLTIEFYKNITGLLNTNGVFVQNIITQKRLELHAIAANSVFKNTKTIQAKQNNFLLIANN